MKLSTASPNVEIPRTELYRARISPTHLRQNPIVHRNEDLQKIGNKVSSGFDLKLPEMNVLDTVAWYGPLTMGDLAGRSFISPSNTTHLVKKLETMGLLKRERAQHSDRIVTVSATEAGLALHARTKPTMIGEVYDYFHAKLSLKEMKKLQQLLSKLEP